jgi:hypothetical protein
MMCDDLETQEELEIINNFLLDWPRTNRTVSMVILLYDGYISDDQILKEMQENDSKQFIQSLDA